METEEKEGKLMPSSGRKLKRYEEDLEIVTTTSAGDGDEIDPYTYLQVIWRHKNVCLIFFFAVIVTAILVSIFTKPTYMATSTVEIALQNPNIVDFREVAQVNTSDPAFFNTQRDLIQSRAMAEAVLTKFNLWDHPDFEVSETNFNPISIMFSYVTKMVRKLVKPVEDTTTQLPDTTTVPGEDNKGTQSVSSLGKYDSEKIRRDSVINTFLSRIMVTPSADSRLITISFLAYSPKFAAQMADAIADTFVEWSLERRLEATRTARAFLEKQLAEVKTNLENSEQSLYQFLANNDIIGLDKNMNLIYRQLDELQKSLAQTASEKTTKESVYKAVQSGNPDTILEVTSDPQIQNLRKQYNDLLIQYSDLSALFKPEYPPLKKLQAQIEGVRSRLNEETKKRIAGLEADYQNAARREELLNERIKEQEKLAMSLNEKTIKYNILDREVQTNKSIYESLLQRFKETDVTGGIQSTGIQVVDRAFIPRIPFSPNIPRNLMLAFIVGLIGAIGVAFVREFFDRTIKTPEEIREKMRLPVLGSLFKIDDLKSDGKLNASTEKLYLADPRSPFSEAIRTIRASILLSSRDRSVRSVLVTSCWPGEGKTTVASNLALSLAYGANRVLLVEADLRHPGVARNFGIDESKPGLSDYLMSRSSLAEVIYPTEIAQLSILPSGLVISNPSELLQSEVMNQLLTRLKEDYDYIVIDSSPAIGLADSLVISTVVDATVVVASTGMTMRRDISYLVKQMSDINAKFLGVVVNRVEMGRENYYYYDRYYKSYYSKGVETVKDADAKMVNQHQKSEFDETGKLDENSYARLLTSYFRDKKTGVLSIDSKLKLRVYFLEGFPVFVEGGDSRTRLGNIAYSEKKIGKEDYAKVLEKVSRTKRKIGEVLIEMGFISPHELDWLLEFQVKEKLIRGFECTTGTYGFQSRADFVDNILTYKANPLQIMYEGIKRYADPIQLEKQFLNATVGSAMVTSEPEIVESLRNVGFSPREYRFLQHLSRGSIMTDISSNNLLPRDDMLKLMYFLRSTGFVKFEEANNSATENQNAI